MKAVATFVGATRQRSRTDGPRSPPEQVTYDGRGTFVPRPSVNSVSTRTASRSGSCAVTSKLVERPGSTSKRVRSAGADQIGAWFGPAAVVEVGAAGAESSVVTSAIRP